MQLLLALLILLTGIATTHASESLEGAKSAKKISTKDTFVRGQPLPKWAQSLAEIPPTSRKDPVVLRLHETQSNVDVISSFLINRATQINDQSALAVIGQFSIDYRPAFQKLNLHRVAILRSGQTLDRTKTVNTRLLQREAGLESGLFGGTTTVQLLLDDVRVGDTLWVTYVVEGDNPVFGKKWSSEFGWDSYYPIELRRLTVLHPKQREVNWKQVGDFRTEEVKPIVDEVGNVRRLRFEGRALEALDIEPSVPNNFVPARILQFSEYKNWQEVAQWANSLFPKYRGDAEIKALLKLFEKEPTQSAKAAAALKWVQNEVRYFSVSIGENSHRPQAPETVIKRRYGDCKDKSYLLISLLDQMGIEAKPVLISAFAPKYPSKAKAAPIIFDHVIVQLKLGEGYYYVDPTRTGQTAQIEKLDTAFPEGTGLLVDVETNALLDLPKKAKFSPHYEHIENFLVDDFEGDVTLETTEVYSGNYAEWARLRYPVLSQADLKKDLLGMYEKQYPGVTLKELPSFKDDATGNYFSITAKYNIPKPITLKDERYWLEFDNNVISGSLGIPDKLVRNFPFALPRGKYQGRYRLNITWPKSLRGNDIPIAKKINNDFFEVTEEFVARGNTLNYMLDYKVKQEQIDTLELPKLHAKAKELERSLFVKISTPKYFVVSGEAQVLPFRDIDTVRLMNWIGLASKELSDKKTGTTSSDDLCELALSMLKVKDALDKNLINLVNSLESEFAKDIKKEGVSQCLARIASANGDFVKSNALFNAKTLPKDGDLLNKELAWVRFYAGDFKGAEETMKRFLAARNLSTEPKSANFDTANEIALRQRLGKDIPASSLAIAKEIPDGIWPRPLLAMQVGVISEADLLVQIDTYSPDMRDIALTEAWFFIGQKKLSEKDVSGAKKAFTWVVRNGLRSSINYLQAKAELSRLEPSETNFEKAKIAADSGDYSLAKKLYEESAKLGFAAAEYEIGELYYYGRGVKQDYVKSFEWYQRAAQKNYAIALNDIGAAYESGKGVKIDGKEAVSWYLKASEIGSSKADYNVGIRYKEGDFLPQDYAKAFFYFERSAQAGDNSSQYELAKLYEEGLGVKVDVAKAMTWANRAVIAGNTNAQVLVGRFYASGFGVAKDEARAARIFKDAAMKGHRLGQYKLALCYTEGKGVEKDLKVAAEWLTKAADSDYGLAQYELAIRYFRSEGVKFDKYYGVRLLMLATQNNVAVAMYELVNLLDEKTKAFTSAEIKIFVSALDKLYALEHGKEARPNESILNHYLRKSAQLGNVDAQINLSRKLRGGIGIDKNKVEAISWLEKAVEKGSLVALVDLADSYENGDGVGKDYAKALELYSRAALAGDSLAFLNLAKLYELGEGTRISFSTAYVYNRIGMRLLKNEKPQYSEDDLKAVKLSDAVSKSLRENEKGEADRVADSWQVKDPLPKLAKN